ncbi:MAG: L,D-transpeptidase family protein [Holophagales bacterium]|nr:L,D-transpeptidase family protein [Holophagales bacterium]
MRENRRCLRISGAAVLVVWLILGPLFLGPAGASADSEGRLRLVVEKGARVLHVVSGEEKVASYPIGLGFEPAGHKRRQGDGATPEGTYRVCVKNPQSRYYLSLGLDYPNARDAEAALADGRISKAEARAITRAVAAGRCPPWNTALGGEIYIHGRGSSSDWTLGCIALDDPPMKRLFDTVPVGTEVEIRP